MNIKALFTLSAVLLVLILVGASNSITAQSMRSVGETKVYLNIDGIEGSVTTKGFEGAIEIESWSSGISYNDETKENLFQDLYFVIQKGGASNAIFKAAVLKTVIPKAVLTVMMVPTDQNFPAVMLFKYSMSNVRVSNLSMGGSAGGSNGIMDQVGLSFESGSYEGKGADVFNSKMPDIKVDFTVSPAPKKADKAKVETKKVQ